MSVRGNGVARSARRSAFRTPKREKFAYFSIPVNRSANVLFVAKRALDQYQLKDLADIEGTGFRRGAWKMMDQGRLDGLIADQIAALVCLKPDVAVAGLFGGVQSQPQGHDGCWSLQENPGAICPCLVSIADLGYMKNWLLALANTT